MSAAAHPATVTPTNTVVIQGLICRSLAKRPDPRRGALGHGASHPAAPSRRWLPTGYDPDVTGLGVQTDELTLADVRSAVSFGRNLGREPGEADE